MMELSGRQLKALMKITHRSTTPETKDVFFVCDDALFFASEYSVIKISLAHNIANPSCPDGMAACIIPEYITYNIPYNKIKVNDRWEITSGELRKKDKTGKTLESISPKYPKENPKLTREGLEKIVNPKDSSFFTKGIEVRINPDLASECISAMNELCDSIIISSDNLYITGHSYNQIPRGMIEKIDFTIAGMRKQ